MENTLFIVSAPSGSGKTVLMRTVMGHEREICSVTTREIRNGEKDGVDYIFVTRETFENMDKSGDLIEKTQYPPNNPNGNFYGVSRTAVESKLNHDDAFIIVDAVGMEQLKKLYPDAVTIYVYTQKNDAIAQMKDRGDSLESIEKRMETFYLEQSQRGSYDYIITNRYGHFWEAANIIASIVHARRSILA